LFTVSGSQTDALVSDYSSKDRPAIGQEARWLVPAVEWPARRIFASFIAQPYRNSEHLSTLLRELANTGIRLPEIGFGTWNYRYGACLIDTAEELVRSQRERERDRDSNGFDKPPASWKRSGFRLETPDGIDTVPFEDRIRYHRRGTLQMPFCSRGIACRESFTEC